MPYRIVKRSGKRPWKILDRAGRVVGTSKTKGAAEASVRARHAGERRP